MTDVIDLAQQRQQEDIELALAARAAPKPGRTCCANLSCREPIAPARQALGAQLCLECQLIHERSAQQCARGVG